MAPLYLGIDFGTSGCRACVVDEAGNPVAEQALALPTPWRDGDEVFQDPAIWWSGLEQLLAPLLVQLSTEQRGSLAAVTIDGTSGTVLLADAELVPQSPALMYNDSASLEQAERIATLAPPDSPARGVNSGLARALRLLPDFAADLRVHSQSDWLLQRLLGRRAAMDSNNALKLGWDAVNGEWPAWFEGLGLSEGLLPEVVTAGTPLGTIDPAVARALSLPKTLQVCAGTTDSTAAIIAAGVTRPGEAVTSLGSTLVVKVVSEQPVFAPEYGVYSQPLPLSDQPLWLVGGASNSGGAVLRQHFTHQQLAELSASINPARRTCLEYYPLPAPGERFPVNDPTLAPKITPRPDDDAKFLQGMLEGIARIERDGYRLLERLGAPYPNSVRSVGGGSCNATWTAIRAAMLGCHMERPLHSEAATGAALLAMRATS